MAGKQDSMVASVNKLARLLTVIATSACASGALAAQPATVSTATSETPSTTAAAASPDTQSSEAETQKDTSKTQWVFISTPYVWMSGSKTKFTTRQKEELTTKDSFFDVLKDLKFALMGGSEARHGRLVLLGDLMFVKLGSSAQGHLGPVHLTADVDLKTLLVTALVGYRAVDHGPMSLDLLAGGRLTGLKANLEIAGPLNTHEADYKKTHIAPVLGARVRMPLGARWGATVYGDVGGFGIGSDISWQALGTVEYELSKHWQLGGGWRHYYGRASDNGFKLAQTLDGPIIILRYQM
jgi:hypothetical protein